MCIRDSICTPSPRYGTFFKFIFFYPSRGSKAGGLSSEREPSRWRFDFRASTKIAKRFAVVLGQFCACAQKKSCRGPLGCPYAHAHAHFRCHGRGQPHGPKNKTATYIGTAGTVWNPPHTLLPMARDKSLAIEPRASRARGFLRRQPSRIWRLRAALAPRRRAILA